MINVIIHSVPLHISYLFDEHILRTYHVVSDSLDFGPTKICKEIPFLKIRHCLKEVFYIKIKLCPYLASLAPFEKSSGNIYSYPLLSFEDATTLCVQCHSTVIPLYLLVLHPCICEGLIVLESHIMKLILLNSYLTSMGLIPATCYCE